MDRFSETVYQIDQPGNNHHHHHHCIGNILIIKFTKHNSQALSQVTVSEPGNFITGKPSK